MHAPGAGNRAGRHIHFKLQRNLKKNTTRLRLNPTFTNPTFTQTPAKAEYFNQPFQLSTLKCNDPSSATTSKSYPLRPQPSLLPFFPHLSPPISTNGIVEIELTLRIILLLQPPQFLQSPRLISIQHLRRLISRRVIHIRIERTAWRIPRVK